ncbi:hypothetical protein NA56DRAFT_742870 [Hyaloscypha hepaticicola]|uniref:Uncharacterized protein n=1 Tax=Hyaloscypha hepaticicola TaxID=2082293 RepID=A0A2J6QMR3_9HELO|nr:hypothetical protein NA56DRAFT_742870 [Hyaloscypha hepaticicola]
MQLRSNDWARTVFWSVVIWNRPKIQLVHGTPNKSKRRRAVRVREARSSSRYVVDGQLKDLERPTIANEKRGRFAGRFGTPDELPYLTCKPEASEGLDWALTAATDEHSWKCARNFIKYLARLARFARLARLENRGGQVKVVFVCIIDSFQGPAYCRRVQVRREFHPLHSRPDVFYSSATNKHWCQRAYQQVASLFGNPGPTNDAFIYRTIVFRVRPTKAQHSRKILYRGQNRPPPFRSRLSITVVHWLRPIEPFDFQPHDLGPLLPYLRIAYKCFWEKLEQSTTTYNLSRAPSSFGPSSRNPGNLNAGPALPVFGPAKWHAVHRYAMLVMRFQIPPRDQPNIR